MHNQGMARRDNGMVELIGKVCFLILGFSWLTGLIILTTAGIRKLIDDEEGGWLFSITGVVLLLFTVGMGSLLFAETHEDNANPCIAWGAPETSYQMVGKIMMPVTRTPCIRRQNSTER